MKKTPPNHYKKIVPPNHHSSTISPSLQTEKTSLHDKVAAYDRSKRKSRDDGKAGISLPEVRGAEGELVAAWTCVPGACFTKVVENYIHHSIILANVGEGGKAFVLLFYFLMCHRHICHSCSPVWRNRTYRRRTSHVTQLDLFC